MKSLDFKLLFEKALQAAKGAYAPYSAFHVGAALLCADSSIVIGVNIENRSYGLTNCAERTAIFTAIAAGKKDFSALVIATPDADYPVSPCGACRQVISEFFHSSTPIAFGSSFENLVFTCCEELFPYDALHELKK